MGVNTFSSPQDFSYSQGWNSGKLEHYYNDLIEKGNQRDRQVKKRVKKLLMRSIVEDADSFANILQGEDLFLEGIDFYRDYIKKLEKYGIDTKEYELLITKYGPSFTRKQVELRFDYLHDKGIDPNRDPIDDFGQYAVISTLCDSIKEAKEFLSGDEIEAYIDRMDKICTKLEEALNIKIDRTII